MSRTFVALPPLALIAAAFTTACGGVHAEMARADREPCDRILARYPALSSDPAYDRQPPEFRQGYETQVARCALVGDKFESSLAIAKGWPDRLALERDRVIARSEAGLHHDDAAAESLDALSKNALCDTSFFTDTPEFRQYRGKDWFVALAVRAWSRSKEGSLHGFAARVIGDEELLALRVAAADPHREKGSWAVWTGVVRDARLDAKTDQTFLLAEGVDVQNEKGAPEAVKSRATVSGNKIESEITSSSHAYQEVFVPNGRRFLVRYPRARDSLAAMRTIVALGRYQGRDGDEGLPLLEAVVVIERKAQRTVQSD
jgi:hypothetical protein